MANVLFTATLPAIVVGIFLVLVFVVAAVRKNNGFMDVAWGICFILIALVSYATFVPRGNDILSVNEGRLALVTILVLIWGIRLATRIYLKNRGKPEDFRYAKWRAEWGRMFLVRSFFQVYLLQGFLSLVVALPIVLIAANPSAGLGVLEYIALCLWLVGFLFEVVGDYQLDQFIRKPENKGKIMRYGLWRYTRHPNYFGESLMWWGLALIAYSAPLGVLAFISPLVITFLLLKVSGVPMLEKKFAGNPEWEEYKSRTNVFIPGPVKKERYDISYR